MTDSRDGGEDGTVFVDDDDDPPDEHATAPTPSITTDATTAETFLIDIALPLDSVASLLGGASGCRTRAIYDRPMTQSPTRRVVTGITAAGEHVIVSDGVAPNSVDTGTFAVSEVFWSEGPRRHIGDDPDRTSPGFPLEPPPGGISGRIIRMPGLAPGVDPDDAWLRVDGDEPDVPGMHATDTLDLMVMLEGSVVLGLDDGERVIGPGEYVVQRGTRHRWRAADEHGWTYFVAMMRPDPGAADSIVGLKPASVGDRPIRRVVTGDAILDGGCSDAIGNTSTVMTDIWHSGGPLTSADQGGDPSGPWSLEPAPGGMWFREVELTPGPPIEAGWHTTTTVDIDVVLRGQVMLELPGGISTILGPGDVVIQRGTDHRWTAVGDAQFAMASVMIDAED